MRKYFKLNFNSNLANSIDQQVNENQNLINSLLENLKSNELLVVFASIISQLLNNLTSTIVRTNDNLYAKITNQTFN